MPLIAPVLDDRTFEQIFAELRNRIPVYTPEWTDYNESDPAVTLLQLFAYLGEGLQFRFNQIPEATQLAFLKMLDLPLQAAGPARALVRCTTERATGAALYAGDQLKAGKALFTIENDARLWPLDCVTVARKKAALPAPDDDAYATVQGTIDAVTASNPAMRDVAPYGTVLLESDGHTPPVSFADVIDGCMWIAVLKKDPKLELQLAPGHALQLSLGFSPTPRTPKRSELKACPGEGATSGPALEWRVSSRKLAADGSPRYVSVRAERNTTAGFTQEGVVQVELPANLDDIGVPDVAPELAGTGAFPPVLDDKRAELVWFWLQVWRSDASRLGEVRLVCLNAVECVQAVEARPEMIGSGSGQPNQVFQLANRPVLVDATHPVRLQVEESGVWTAWQQQDDLDASSDRDRHFTVDAEAGSVRFGERFPQIGERVRVTGYRYGGGAAGNVPPHAIAKLGELLRDPVRAPDPPAPMVRAEDAKFDNPFKAEGGFDSETIEQGLERIPGDLRRRTRAVTRDDFSELAMMTPGVDLGRAECLPLFHAPDREAPRAGVVSVVVWPASDPVHPNAPLPDAFQLRRVCEWLDTKRLVTTELYVIPPVYRRVAISLAIKVKDGFGLDAVRDWVELVLRQYLAPLPPHGPEGRGWTLGRRVLDRELEGVAMQVQGVEYVAALRLAGAVRLAAGSLQAEASEIGDAAAQATEQWQEGPTVTFEQWEVPEVAAIAIVAEGTDLPAPGQDAKPPPGAPPVPIPVPRDEC